MLSFSLLQKGNTLHFAAYSGCASLVKSVTESEENANVLFKVSCV